MILAVHMVWTCIANLSHGVIWSHQKLWIRDTDYILFFPLTLVDLMQLSLTGDHSDVMFLFFSAFFPGLKRIRKPSIYHSISVNCGFAVDSCGVWMRLWPNRDRKVEKKKDDEEMIMDPPKSLYFFILSFKPPKLGFEILQTVLRSQWLFNYLNKKYWIHEWM